MVVFLQGCNIKCLYCQNADTIPHTGGTEYTVDQLVQKACNMKSYFGHKGGVTVSGGEPLLQSKVLILFFEKLHEQGIHTNIDTNGTIVNSHAKRLIEDLADLVMFDIKHATPLGFEKLTGKQLYAQSEELIDLREKNNKPFWFRYVLIPGITSDPEFLEAVGKKYGAYRNLQRFQVLPYHKFGVHKWEEMSEEYALKDTPQNTIRQVEEAKEILSRYFDEVV